MKNYNNNPTCDECPLLNNGIFSEQNSEQWLGNENCRQITYQKGETVVKQGAFASHLLYVRNGLIKMVIEGDSEKNIIVDFINSGNFIGFPILFSEDYYPFTVNSLKQSQICLIKKDRFVESIKKTPRTLLHMQVENGVVYKHLFEKLAIVGTKQMHGRLAHALLYLNDEKFADDDLFSCINRKDIAEFVGMSSESMVRLLNEFKSDKLITIKRKNIIVTDKEMLMRLCRVG